MKSRFEAFDVYAIVSELRNSIIGYRLVNIYDASSKIYMLKLSGSSSDEKQVLLLESGVRMHLTSFAWPKNTIPLGFTMKLRKHIKNKKVSNIKQLGIDRVVDITFGFNEHAFHFIVELYGKGNMFLTDADYIILHLLRPRTDFDQDVRYATRERFPIELARPMPESLLNFEDDSSFEKLVHVISDCLVDAKGPWHAAASATNAERSPIVSVLNNVFTFGSSLIEHCCFRAGLLKKKEISEPNPQIPIDSEACRLNYSKKIALALREVLIQISERKAIGSNDTAPIPAIILGVPSSTEVGKLSKFELYHPLQFAHLSSKAGLEFASFNKAVDEFYSSLEIRRSEIQVVQNAKSANKRLENITRDQEQRLGALKAEQLLDNQKAQLLELNMDLVDTVIVRLNSAIANRTSWEVLEEVLEKQKKQGDDPVANCIVQLQLASNQALLRLSNPYAEDDGDEKDDALTVEVLVDLDSTAFQNAKRYHTHRRHAEAKEQKTVAGTKLALKAATKKTEKALSRVREAPKLVEMRKSIWFEKFHWFISSDNYLVLAGRDAVQNEFLIKRHFRQHDIYVHADVHGASSVIVKARCLQACEKITEDGVVTGCEDAANAMPQPPLRTLIEAGQMAVVLSNAWSAKVITNAWWVRYDQVSKTAPSGEYLSTGSFVIRGRKNVLPQCHLTYGIGILFKLGEDSMERHRGERHIDLDAAMQAEAAIKKYSVPPPTDDIATQEDMDSEVSSAFDNVTLNLNINRPSKLPSKQSVQQRKSDTSLPQTPVPSSQMQSKPKPTGPNPLKRGQKAKMKRIRTKYADQDEEERQIRLQILQGAKAKLSVVHEIGKAVRIEEEKEDDEGEEEKDTLPPVEEKKSERFSNAVDSNVETVVATITEVEAEANREDEFVATTGEVSTLETLTGQPTVEDTLLFALPFCAPYTALQQYKYKAKLLPGTQKRGKITKMAIHHFTLDKMATDLEKQLIGAIREEDVCRVMPGSSKISFPGQQAPKSASSCDHAWLDN